MVLGVIFDGFGCPEGSLCGFGGSWSPGGFLSYFRTCPWGPRILGTWMRVVKGLSVGPNSLLNQDHHPHLDWSFRLQAPDCKLTNSYLEDSMMPDC